MRVRVRVRVKVRVRVRARVRVGHVARAVDGVCEQLARRARLHFVHVALRGVPPLLILEVGQRRHLARLRVRVRVGIRVRVRVGARASISVRVGWGEHLVHVEDRLLLLARAAAARPAEVHAEGLAFDGAAPVLVPVGCGRWVRVVVLLDV